MKKLEKVELTYGRKSGRTYRVLLLSIMQASQGERVVFLTPHLWKYAFNMAKQLTTGFATTINCQLGLIRFPNNGELKFMRDDKHTEDKLRGINPVIVRDN